MASIDQTGPLQLFLDDVVRLRKPHPCGGCEWTVVRLGADIGLRCHGCDHKVLLSRRTLQKRLAAFVSRGPGHAAALALQQQVDGPPDAPPDADDTDASPR